MKPFPFERDPVIEAYKKDVDRTLLRENLRCSVDERMENLLAMARLAEECQRSREAAKSQRQAAKSAPTPNS